MNNFSFCAEGALDLTDAEFQACVGAVLKGAETLDLSPEDEFEDDVFNAIVSLKQSTWTQLLTLTPEWGTALYDVARIEEKNVAMLVLSDTPGVCGQRDDPVRSVVYEHLAFLRSRDLPEASWITPEALSRLKALFLRHFTETGKVCGCLPMVFGETPFVPGQYSRSGRVFIKPGDSLAVNGVPIDGLVGSVTSTSLFPDGDAQQLCVLMNEASV